MSRVAKLLLIMAVLPAGACNFELGGGSTITPSSLPGELVVTGTIVEADTLVPCLLFESAGGRFFHLLQGPQVSDAQFVQLSRLGVGSTLEVRFRRDVDLRCQADDDFEVLEVLDVLQVRSTAGE